MTHHISLQYLLTTHSNTEYPFGVWADKGRVCCNRCQEWSVRHHEPLDAWWVLKIYYDLFWSLTSSAKHKTQYKLRSYPVRWTRSTWTYHQDNLKGSTLSNYEVAFSSCMLLYEILSPLLGKKMKTNFYFTIPEKICNSQVALVENSLQICKLCRISESTF